MLEKRARILMGPQEAHHVGPEPGIARAGVSHVCLARGWLAQQGLVENRPQAPVPVGSLAHWWIFGEVFTYVNKDGRLYSSAARSAAQASDVSGTEPHYHAPRRAAPG